MNAKAKTGVLALAFLTSLALLGVGQNVQADYWTRYTRPGSGNVLPQYFELENMTKSSLGVRFLYGNDRINMADENSFVRHLITFDGTNWTDQTSAVETATGYSDIQFQNMYSDSNGNVWMPNRADPNRPLIEYVGSTGSYERTSDQTIGDQAGVASGLRINNLFTGPGSAIYAVASSGDGHLYIIYYQGGTWHNTGITGGPLDAYGADGDIYGVYSSIDSGSYWLYRYHSSENEFTNGTDEGPGIWKYASAGWTHYDSSLTTASGTSFVNGITEAFADSTGKIWVGSRHGVFMYNGTDWVNWTKDNNNIFTNRVIKVQEDSSGRVWIICLENENDPQDNGGISIYNPSDNSWDYYTSYNGEDAIANATNIFMIGAGGDEIWMFTGHGEEAMTAGIYALTRDSAHTAIYGQTSGTTLNKASLLDAAKKKTKKSSNKKVTIYKLKKVKKKWKKTAKVYSSPSYKQWYKALNLKVGRYRIDYKAKGKKKKSKTITVSSGDPYRLNLK